MIPPDGKLKKFNESPCIIGGLTGAGIAGDSG